jgi:glycosyltransferase 2 family protein
MAFPLRKHLNLILGLGISALAVYLSFRKIDFPLLWGSIRSISLFLLLPAVGCLFFCFLFKGIGWHYLLKPAKQDISWISTTIVLIIGLMVNDLFPAKMGELARAYLIGEREKLPKTLCLSTIMVEHLLDILILSLFLLILLPLVAIPLWLRSSGLLVGLGALGIIVVLVLIMRQEEKSLKFISRLFLLLPERFRGKVLLALRNMIQGFRVVTGRYILYALGCLFAMWCVVFLFTYVIMMSLGFSLPFYAAIMVVIFSAFAKIIPSSPGAVGTYHYAVIVVLTAFGISKEMALGLAIVLHGCGLVVEVVMGVSLLFSYNISLSKITRPEAAP